MHATILQAWALFTFEHPRSSISISVPRQLAQGPQPYSKLVRLSLTGIDAERASMVSRELSPRRRNSRSWPWCGPPSLDGSKINRRR